MRFIRKRPKKNKRRGIILLLLLIPILFLLYKFTPVYNYLITKTQSFSYLLFNRAEQINLKLDDKNIFYYKNENDQLKLELADITYKYAQTNIYKQENIELKKILKYQENNNLNYVQSKVIGRDKELRNTYILDKGSRDGVSLNDAVIVGEGNLVGKITAVKDSVSFLTLITDPQISVKVTKVGGVEPIGVTKGEFGLSVVVDLIPQTIAIQEGDIIISSGFEDEIAQGLVLGKVNRILSKDNDLFQSVSIIPIINYNSLSLVSIISK